MIILHYIIMSDTRARSFLTAFDPKNGNSLFWCFLHSTNRERLISRVINMADQSPIRIKRINSIPPTVVKPKIQRFGDFAEFF